MTTENQLITKSYYQSVIGEDQRDHPVKVLGEMYLEEVRKDPSDLAAIRFAQGEVYFHNHDYEAAIYKWQQPFGKNLTAWGQKNIADAEMEMGLLEQAEESYRGVKTHSVTLKTEVLLQLFSLYLQQEKREESVVTIKEAVQLNPDYADVTQVAQRYFEEIEDWENAIQLAIDESIRTASLYWFEVLEGYAERGLLTQRRPSEFHSVLSTLYAIDKHHFERLTAGLWESYRESDVYFDWLTEVNELLLELDVEASYQWDQLPGLYQEGYFYLISGEFLINEISVLVQYHLTNWCMVSSASDQLMSSAAILAWNEQFPSELAISLVNEAEKRFENAEASENDSLDGVALFNAIQEWAAKESLLDALTEFTEPMLAGADIDKMDPAEIHNLLKESLGYIVEHRKALEASILEDVAWNEEVLTELREFHRKVSEIENIKADIMPRSFRDGLDKLVDKLEAELPDMLRKCSHLIKEDSDFSTLHVQLNDEMNRQIAQYMEREFLPEVKSDFQDWLNTCENEFRESQQLFDQFRENINEKFDAEKLKLVGDFQVLSDWKRDIDRATRALLRLDDVNILLRNNPAQLLLKGAGKILGSLTSNNDMLVNRYKDYIEKANYREVVVEIRDVFTQQLEPIEESVEWDVRAFYANPEEELRGVIEELEVVVDRQEGVLEKMREKPEVYQNPLTLFELKLRHYELINMIDVTA